MTLLVLVPFLFSLMVAVACAFYILKRKSLAQAHCVQQSARLQNELRQTLDQLLALNPQARRLRAQRMAADKALHAALASLNPSAIAAAKAYRAAVLLQQTALHLKQQNLLRRADLERQSAHRELRERLASLKVKTVNSRKYYWRSLAVEARPPNSLTPDYEPIAWFENFQQHRFRFDVDLRPSFARVLAHLNLKQSTECSVSLKGSKNKWQLQVIAANAPSKLSWF